MGVDICQDIKSGKRSAPEETFITLFFFFSVRVDLFRHNGIHPGREAQFVDPEETESELQQQRRDIHTATRAREMQILFIKNKAPPSLCVIQPLPLKRHEEYTEREVKRLRGR